MLLQKALLRLERTQLSRAPQHNTEQWANSLPATQTGTQTHVCCHAGRIIPTRLYHFSQKSAPFLWKPALDLCYSVAHYHLLLTRKTENSPKVTVWMAKQSSRGRLRARLRSLFDLSFSTELPVSDFLILCRSSISHRRHFLASPAEFSLPV